ncbi:uncharacterized protein LOC141855877 [Brevipalpus obovatus]|uniref:uncharacterized protein LOC141855877 n=1 Tax=Brevipalpus obovatus TaxID=246614 RepID=UPI003D9EAC87
MMSKFYLCATVLLFILLGAIYCDFSNEELSENPKKMDNSRALVVKMLRAVGHYCQKKDNFDLYKEAVGLGLSLKKRFVGRRKAIKAAHLLWSRCSKGEALSLDDYITLSSYYPH